METQKNAATVDSSNRLPTILTTAATALQLSCYAAAATYEKFESKHHQKNAFLSSSKVGMAKLACLLAGHLQFKCIDPGVRHWLDFCRGQAAAAAAAEDAGRRDLMKRPES